MLTRQTMFRSGILQARETVSVYLPVEAASLVAKPWLSGTKLPEVLGRFWNHIFKKFKGNAADILSAHFHIKVDLGVGHHGSSGTGKGTSRRMLKGQAGPWCKGRCSRRGSSKENSGQHRGGLHLVLSAQRDIKFFSCYKYYDWLVVSISQFYFMTLRIELARATKKIGVSSTPRFVSSSGPESRSITL